VLPTVRAGDEVLIGARVTGEVKGDVILRGTVAGQAYEQKFPLALAVSTSAGNAFVPRLWASLAIEQLERDGKGEDRARIVAMSQGYGVMSRHTSLLVLESQAMFDAFGVDRTRPSAQWTGEDAVDEVAAAGDVDFDPPAPPAKPGHDDAGYGGLLGASSGRSRGKLALDIGDADDAGPVGGGGSVAKDKNDSSRDDNKLADQPDAAANPAPATKTTEPPEEKAARDAKGEVAKRKAPAADPARRGPPLDRFGRPMVQVRRTWKRVAAVGEFGGVSAGITAAIGRAEDDLAANPDSREKHRALVQALAYAGELDRAIGIAKRWLERDRLDPQALGYLADLVGRRGDRDAALRLTAGMIDLDADSTALHERLAGAYERGGRIAQACAHRVALSTLRAAVPGDKGKDASAAVRCLRALGRTDDAALVLRGLPRDDLRLAAEKAATAAPLEPRVAGDLVIKATWSDGSDLDLSVVTPQGTRVSWLGGRTDLVVADTLAKGDEKLALKSLKKGNYLLEIGRTAQSRPGTAPTRGTIEITALGVKRTLPFELAGDRAVVGRVAVTMQAQLQWLDGSRFVR
jgi:tetratricopeptide (TPR) repeat protein